METDIIPYHYKPRLIGGLYYEAGFSLIEVNSGLTLGFPYYEAGSLLTGVNLHGNLC